MAILQSPVGSQLYISSYIRIEFLSTVIDQNCCISQNRYSMRLLDEERDDLDNGMAAGKDC